MFNSRSICNKLFDIYNILSSNKYDFIFITESWTNDNINTSILTLDYPYNILRKDRVGKKGGGVLVYYRKTLSVSDVDIPKSYEVAETIVFDVHLKNYSIRFLTVYLSPNNDELHFVSLSRLIGWVNDTSQQTIIVGDFNFPLIKWNKTNIISETSIDFSFYSLVADLGLYQFVQSPTLNKNILDLVLLII